MVKIGKKKGLERSNSAPARRASKKNALAAKPGKKGSGRRAATPGKADHHAVFKSLAARSNRHNQAPICYHQLADGSWMICFLQRDGSYAQCQPYSGPIHEPPCG
jgi:hypothetical protein